TSIYAVGTNSTLLHSQDGGLTWPGAGAVPSTGTTLNAVHCSGDGLACWVVGSAGAAWRYDSATNSWRAPAPTKVTGTLNDVWVVSDNDVWAVGISGTIIHFDGTRWTRAGTGTCPYSPPTNQDLKVVQMLSSTEGYAGGGGTGGTSSGVLLH